MLPAPSIDRLRAVLTGVTLVRPPLTVAARFALREAATVLEAIGLPHRFGGWFEACEEIDVYPPAEGQEYLLGGRPVRMSHPTLIGRSLLQGRVFGVDLIDCDTGAVVDLAPR